MVLTIQTCWPGEVMTQVFTRFPVTIGRDARSSLRLPQRFVSRAHVRIERVGDSFVLIDESSRNGTVYAGRRLGRCEAVPLVDGAEIHIEWLVLRVRFLESSTVQAADRPAAFPAVSGGDAAGAPGHDQAFVPRPAGGIVERAPALPVEMAAPAHALLGVLRQLGLGDDSVSSGRPRSEASELQAAVADHFPVRSAPGEPSIASLLEGLDVNEPVAEASVSWRRGNRAPAPDPGRRAGPSDGRAVVVAEAGIVRLFRGIASVLVHAVRALLARPPRPRPARSLRFAQASSPRPAPPPLPFSALSQES